MGAAHFQRGEMKKASQPESHIKSHNVTILQDVSPYLMDLTITKGTSLNVVLELSPLTMRDSHTSLDFSPMLIT